MFRKPTIEQLGEFIAPTFQALIDGALYVQPRLEAIVDELGPDTIVEDNVVSFPAIMSTTAPWVRLLSCNPAEIKDPGVPPFSSGYPADDRSAWPSFLGEVDRTHREMWTAFDAFCRDAGAAGPAVDEHGPGLHAREPVPQHLLVPRRGRLRAIRAARPDVAPARLDHPRRRHGLAAARRAGEPGRRVDLPEPRQPRLGRRGADAAAGGPAGADARTG